MVKEQEITLHYFSSLKTLCLVLLPNFVTAPDAVVSSGPTLNHFGLNRICLHCDLGF